MESLRHCRRQGYLSCPSNGQANKGGYSCNRENGCGAIEYAAIRRKRHGSGVCQVKRASWAKHLNDWLSHHDHARYGDRDKVRD